jgi:hypothetical protein
MDSEISGRAKENSECVSSRQRNANGQRHFAHKGELRPTASMDCTTVARGNAGNNTSEGFQTEVRRALTENAFYFEKARPFSKRKDLENPLPGHPASDLVTAVLNKLLDEVEFNPSKKKLGKD